MPKKAQKLKKPTVENDAEALTMRGAMEQLKITQGWSILMRAMAGNLKSLEIQILDKTDDKGKSLDDLEVDRLRDKRGYLVELQKFPERIIEESKRSEFVIEDLDPYAKKVDPM